ncbi:MAG TPA: M1 family aminopeptidase [Fulvivirga sp.]|nr:M1 family aminopeptidase [Fulvivirga sp.]
MRPYQFSWLPLLAIVLFFSGCANQDSRLLDRGISKELAVFRKKNIDNVNYDLTFDIPATKNKAITGNLILQFKFKEGITDLILDFNAAEKLIHQIKVQGKVVEAKIANEHIVIPSKYLSESNKVEISFTAGELSLNRNDDYLFTLFVPERASTCFPLFDQPDLKAEYKLALRIPKNWNAVANGAELKVLEDGELKTIEFEKTLPISSYLFAFAAGEFDIITKMVNGREMRMFHRESDSTKVLENVEAIFQQHGEAIDWLENYTGIPYPFPKFDFVLIPSFQYGGMEHPGAVFYKAASLFLNKSSTLNEKMGRANLIAHETAHMWFGDLVTMPWFDDVWLKEVFANFMAAKIVNPQFPDVNHDLQFLMTHYPAAYDVDRTEGTHPIAQKLDNLKNAGSLYGNIIYKKAPIVMRMLENKIGDSTFQKGIRRYLSENEYGNASWDDLIEILSNESQQNLKKWDNKWVKNARMPLTMNRLRFGNSKLKKIMLINYGHGNNKFWPQPLTIGFIHNDTLQLLHAEIDSPSTSIKTDAILNPDYVFTNYGGMGYGYFTMGPNSKEYFLNNIQQQSSLLRGCLWINYYEMVLRQQLRPEKLMEAILKSLPVENEPIIVDYLNRRLEILYWKLFTPTQREVYASKIEAILLNMAINTTATELKSSYFQTFYNVAITQHSVDMIKNIWSDKLELDGLEISENDYIRMAYELAIKEKDSASIILNQQLQRIKNKDRKARMNWVMQALDPDLQKRDAFFASLKKEENRETEEWVLEAMHYLNHPMRQHDSEKYIGPGLELLEEIKTTGDIFFPQRWLSALLDGHQTETAADGVRQFLYKHNKYPPDLKNKILQSSDMLFRAIQIQSEMDTTSTN